MSLVFQVEKLYIERGGSINIFQSAARVEIRAGQLMICHIV